MVWEKVRRLVSIAGTIAGVSVAISGITWHDVAVDSPATLAAGVAMGASFFLVGTLKLPFAAAVMSGAAAMSLALAAATGWTVPFLAFWLCFNTALVLRTPTLRISWMSAGVLLADLPLVSGLVLIALRDDVWRIPRLPGTAIVSAVCLSALMRIVSVSFGRHREATAPLVAGSAFVLVALLGPEAAPLLAALLVALASVLAFRPITPDPVAFVSCLAMGAALLHGPLLPMAAIATVLMVSAASSTDRPGRSGIALLAGPWPGTAFFVVVIGAAVHSAERVTGSGLLAGGSYLLVSVLLPIALAGSVHIAAPLLRSSGTRVWGTAEICALVSMGAGLSAAGFSATDPSGYLYLSGLFAGGLFIVGIPSLFHASPDPQPVAAVTFSAEGPSIPGADALRRAGLAALVVAWLGVAWATYGGLRDGFL